MAARSAIEHLQHAKHTFVVGAEKAHIDAELGTAALRMMESNMRAKVVPVADCLS